MKNATKTLISFALLSLSPSLLASSYYYHERVYEVTVTNLTKGIAFTPVLGTTHLPRNQLFRLGEPVTDNVERVAEGGDIGPLRAELDASSQYSATAASEGLLTNGQSVTFEITSQRPHSRISLISMLLPTNDTMVSLRGKRLPRYIGTSVTYQMHAYDAGTEANDELCANIPGPLCGGQPFSADAATDEGYVYPSPGIHGEGDLAQSAYDWQGAVAKVRIKRIQ
ncbi:spondin domain-containing protein [Vibrio nigripulchritudo]|uniref:spondin domain-containing protein n=1 Tax=Vibrio nigripulchritudo TaxID=28173 RepID=UPI0024932AE7|nr:spondin domain-containing protein [Vibrio nigripulchritudo]BDU36757.1 hypothetical protein TUMSATVNIG2_12260 [Vibrio nigripulchritudo]BDU42467.1 hypothetical protein TUMSATVNIG3_12650 [Vibrio nigripulchritudo]